MPLSINILYGSQNGTARHVAENLDKDLSSENIPTTLLTLNEYKNVIYIIKEAYYYYYCYYILLRKNSKYSNSNNDNNKNNKDNNNNKI